MHDDPDSPNSRCRRPSRDALAELLANAKSTGLIGPGEPTEMATDYLGLLWEGLMGACYWGCRDDQARRGRATSNKGDGGVYAAPPRYRKARQTWTAVTNNLPQV